MRAITLGLLMLLSVGQRVMVAQSVSDSAVGAWTLNHAKSTFSGAVSLKRVDDRTVERTGKVQGQVVETETRTVSDNGKVLTVTTKGSRNGSEYSSVQVYDRQP